MAQMTSVRPRRCKVLRTCSTVKRLKKVEMFATRQAEIGLETSLSDVWVPCGF